MAGPVRQQIDATSLERYIASNVPDIAVPLDIKQFGYGQSNPTYLLTDKNGGKYVLRKKPPGKLLSKTAHKVDREYRIIHALDSTDVPVPKAYCLCRDEAVIGTDFYIMEYLDGRIFEDPVLSGVTPEERTEMWHSAVTTLAKLHRIPPSSINLSTFGKPSAFYTRQLSTFARISASQASVRDIETHKPVGPIPHQDAIIAFFADPATQPKDRATLVHGDYKVDNLVFHKTEPRVVGILDWEMSTVGHPLSDLNNLLMPYATATSAHASAVHKAHTGFLPSATPGLPSREQLWDWYAEIAGWDPRPDFPWGDAFSTFKLTVIMQGIAARYALRQASSALAREHGELRGAYAEMAWELVNEVQGKKRKARL